MGSDPQSILNWDDQNCKCAAGRERPGLLKKVAELEAKNKEFEEKIAKIRDNTRAWTLLAGWHLNEQKMHDDIVKVYLLSIKQEYLDRETKRIEKLEKKNKEVEQRDNQTLEAFKNKIEKLYVENHDQSPDGPGVKVTDDLVLAWIGELAKKIKLPTLSVDDFDDLMGDIACSSAHYFAGLFLSFAKIDEIADGQYEDMKDATYALARLVARELGYPLADMDKDEMHEIERDLADFNTPVCPNDCEHVKTCAEKPKFHHIKNKIECVIWHMKKANK
jgi:hypothetical protein